MSQGGLVESMYRSTISYENENPYMRNAVGFKLPFRKVDVYVDLYFHESSISSDKDRGVNGYPAIRAQWFPFR